LFDIRLQIMTESTGKILKLDWKTGIIFHPKEWEPYLSRPHFKMEQDIQNLK